MIKSKKLEKKMQTVPTWYWKENRNNDDFNFSFVEKIEAERLL